MMDIIVIIAFTAVLAQFLTGSIIKMLRTANKEICRKVNYSGKGIPAIGGIVFIPVVMAASFLLLIFGRGDFYDYLSYLLLIMSMGFIGVIDDLIGDRRIKGFVNHVRHTLRGKMTTGFLKAFTGFLAACIICYGNISNPIEYIVSILIISLFANTINLFDLRPGRAVKVFLAISLVLMTSAADRIEEALLLVMITVASVFYIPYDLKEICMLGDTGANILGITLGYYCSRLLSADAKLPLLAMLLTLNIMSEKMSITEMIRNSRLLSYIDGIGRRQTDNR